MDRQASIDSTGQSHAFPPPMVHRSHEPAWEYRHLVRNLAKEDAPTADELNALGAQGWELVGMFSDSPFIYFYFKRPAG